MFLLTLGAACVVMGTVERPAAGGVYREAVVGQPLSLNPLLDPQDPITRDVARLAHAGLVRLTDRGEIHGDLAEGRTVSEDGRTYTFRLKPGAVWHDGQPVKASDVLATVEFVQSPAYPGPTELAWLWRRVQTRAPDPRTVVFQLDEAYALFLEACSLPILPEAMLRGDSFANLREHPASYVPVGAGPFRVERTSLEGISLVRHEGYHGSRPYIERIDLAFYRDGLAAAQALQDGRVDGLTAVASGALRSAAPTDRFALYQVPLLSRQTVLFLNHRQAVLADRRVRQAIALAIDRAELLGGALAGDAVVAFGPMPVYSSGYRPEVEISRDLSRAGALLDGAGWVGPGTRFQGTRPLELELLMPSEPQALALAEGLAAQVAAAGFRIPVQPVQALDMYRERLIPGRYALALVGVWLGGVEPDLYWLWHSSQRERGLNFGAYASDEADGLLHGIRVEVDGGRRQALVDTFQRLWIEDVPGVVLASPLMTYAISREVQGVRLGIVPEPGARFQHFPDWYIRTERVPSLGG